MVLLIGSQSVISITHKPLTVTKYNLDGNCDSPVLLSLPPIVNNSNGPPGSISRGADAEESSDDDNVDNIGENGAESNSNTAKSDGNVTCFANEKRHVVSGGLSPSEKFLVLCDDHKQLIVYEVDSWKVMGAIKVERKCDHIIFNEKEDKFIVSDRSGWIYGYEINAFIDHSENKGKFLLGHNAIILDVKFSPGSRFLATCDRDEKIRISNFPNSYNIESYCLGHTEFVSCLGFIDDQTLVSGSGDGTLRVWEYIKGKELSCHNFKDDLELNQKDDKIAPMEIHITTVDVIGTVVIVTFFNSPTFITYTYDKTTKSLVNLIKTKVEANILGSALNNCGGFLCFIEQPFSIACFELSMYKGEVCLFEASHKLTTALLQNVKFVEEYIVERKQLTNIGWLWKNSYNNQNVYLERKKERQETQSKKLKSI
ncbi:tRNA (guanine-N(7)-)-methyltransferase non-catalytic subunit WDR4-like [Panonychus citri]|uniref:tRNA (guanine-N(7)-)-methyltransferase non-catalytic subunit WDR4-like n=1 Tax=Panonychus citri TaxID=50023 RepID=UPI002307D0FB|nr:tRNA (guanine-N(7)-)-methyltransferase non-catalytic subunit WDR4-like [Panonychus citri]